MNAVWDSGSKSWVIYQHGCSQKYCLKISWSEGIAAFLEGGEIQDCKIEVSAGLVSQKTLVVPHPSQRVGEYQVRAFPLLEL